MSKLGTVVGQGGLKPADKALLIPGNIRSGVTIDGVTGDSNVVDTSSGTAKATEMLNGKFAYVDGILVEGTIPSRGSQTYIPGTSNQSIPAGRYLSGNQTIQGDSNLVSANIKKGQTIFGVAGNSNVVDTSDANAAAGHIYAGATAYVNGQKVTGTIPEKSGSSMFSAGSDAFLYTSVCTGVAENSYVGAWDVVIPYGYYNGINSSRIHIPNAMAGNIRSGVKVGWTNNYIEGTFTSDATASAGDILSGKTAYVGGNKVTGTIPSAQAYPNNPTSTQLHVYDGKPNGSHSVFMRMPNNTYIPASGDYWAGIDEPNLNPANIKAGVTIGDAANITGTFTSDANATANLIFPGATAYVNGVKITGTMAVYSSGTNVNADAISKTGNTLRLSVPTERYYSDNTNIQYTDNDWVESNIKAGVDIFGKVGTLEEGTTVKSSGTWQPTGENYVFRDGYYYVFLGKNGSQGWATYRDKYNTSGTLIESTFLHSERGQRYIAFENGYTYYTSNIVARDFNGTVIQSFPLTTAVPNTAWYDGSNTYGDTIRHYYSYNSFNIMDKNGSSKISVSLGSSENSAPIRFINNNLVVYWTVGNCGFCVRDSSGNWTNKTLDTSASGTNTEAAQDKMGNLLSLIHSLSAGDNVIKG